MSDDVTTVSGDSSIVDDKSSEPKSTGVQDGAEAEAGPTEDDPVLTLEPSNVQDKEVVDYVFAEMEKLNPNVAASLRTRWGGDAQANLAYAQNAVDKLTSRDLNDFLETVDRDGVPLGNHPAVIDLAARIGRLLAAGSSPSSSGTDKRKGVNTSNQGIQSRIDKIHEFSFTDPSKYKSHPIQDELQGLYEKLHGGQPIVGAGGRTA